ncbi:MAG: hypothetical protein R6W69_14810 [Anaerolineales bacterium]
METINFSQLALVAFLVEALIQTIKPIYDKEKGFSRSRLLSIGTGIVVCLVTGVDLFTSLGFEINTPILGQALTGIIASRGSNLVHDILTFVQGKAKSQPSEPEAYG